MLYNNVKSNNLAKITNCYSIFRGYGSSTVFGSSGTVVNIEQWRCVHVLRGHTGGNDSLRQVENVYVYQCCYWHYIWHDKFRLWRQAFDFYQGYVSGESCFPSSSSEFKLLNTFEFIKAVSDAVLGMINAA